MKRVRGWTPWFARQTGLRLQRRICCSEGQENFLARVSPESSVFILRIHFATRNCSSWRAKKRSLWSKTEHSERSSSASCGCCPASGSAAITWRRWARMRVIAGTYRSRILKSLKGMALRPTSDRLRETLFNVLGPGIAGARFIDLFAGTGAVGIEALSRGADEVVFVENHAPAATLIRRNLESLEVRKGATVLASDALRGLQTLVSRPKGR